MKLLSMLAAALVSSSPEPAYTGPRSAALPAELLEPASLERSGEREISVLTYNVRGLPWPLASGRAAALRDIGRELAEMRRQGRSPDVVLIQEGFEDMSDLVRLSGYRFHAVGPLRGDRASGPRKGFARIPWLVSGEGWGKLTNAGLHVLSDLPLAEVDSQPFGVCAGFDCLANKGAMLVQVKLAGVPAPVEIVNTHMNSRAAAKVPFDRSLQAHNLQSEALFRFIETARTPGSALIVGGDFNVKGSPGRYYHRAADRPFVVVAEFCNAAPDGCPGNGLLDGPEPWLATQDLQAFSAAGRVTIRPMAFERLFAGAGAGPRLSDHDGVLVRYRLSWSETGAPPRMVAELR